MAVNTNFIPLRPISKTNIVFYSCIYNSLLYSTLIHLCIMQNNRLLQSWNHKAGIVTSDVYFLRTLLTAVASNMTFFLNVEYSFSFQEVGGLFISNCNYQSLNVTTATVFWASRTVKIIKKRYNTIYLRNKCFWVQICWFMEMLWAEMQFKFCPNWFATPASHMIVSSLQKDKYNVHKTDM